MLFAFLFPEHAGHFNASLPVARALVKLGHDVHYLCQDSRREAIESTGAVFHSEVEQKPELYEGRDASFGPMMLMSEYPELASDNPILAVLKLNGALMMELQLPGELRWLQKVKPDVIFYNPELTSEAGTAAQILGIPSVGLITLAGPGGMEKFMTDMLAMGGLTPTDIEEPLKAFAPHVEAVSRLNRVYNLNIKVAEPFAFMQVEKNCANIVTTIEDLQDPMSEGLANLYNVAGTKFTYAGPLLEERAWNSSAQQDVLSRVRAAKEAGRPIVLVSMGTMVPGEGWDRHYMGANGKAGLSGRELCHGVWRGAFAALGADDAIQGPLVLVSVGPRGDALEGITVPPNAIIAPVLPQVDILRIGVNVFLTHGGQNSFVEAMSTGTPVVVCPYDTDQPVNAQKAVSLGVGLKVDRPDLADGDKDSALAKYSESVSLVLLSVQGNRQFSDASSRIAERVTACKGVPLVADLLVAAGSTKAAAVGS